jgi:hypothetical protein
MTEKFNPAPKDKHAEDPKQAQKSVTGTSPPPGHRANELRYSLA